MKIEVVSVDMFPPIKGLDFGRQKWNTAGPSRKAAYKVKRSKPKPEKKYTVEECLACFSVKK